MGTSTGYSAPPSWGDLKGDVTRAAKEGLLSSEKAGNLLKSFIQHNGGAGSIARGEGGKGRKGTVISGRSARNVAGRIGGFISDIGRVGLEGALREAGWDDLVGRPVKEILGALLDRLGGNANTINDVDARMALSQLQEKYFGNVETITELEQRLSNQVNQLDLLLQDFFGLYLFEVFNRVFFEQLVQKIGDTQAYEFLNEIGNFINATLENRMIGRNISQIDWAGPEGQAITSDIMETTLNVFGG